MSQNRLPGITNPQNTKRLGQFLTTDYKSVETPNGRLRWVVDYELSSDRRPGGFEIRRKKGSTYENWGFVIPQYQMSQNRLPEIANHQNTNSHSLLRESI